MTEANRTENTKLEKIKGENASAILLTKGLEAQSHRGVQRLFHLHFIRTGIFPDGTGVLLSHAQKAREEADYFPEISFTKEIAHDRMREVEDFIKVSRNYLSTLGIV